MGVKFEKNVIVGKSITLKQLKEHELVECINPEVRKGRLYRLTEKGEKIVDNL